MGYAIARIKKLKNSRGMTDSYNHNMRIVHVENADPVMSRQNVDLHDQLQGRSYTDVFEDVINELKRNGGQQKTIRKDAVLGFEVMLTYSRESGDISIEEWAKANVEWLKETFNPKNNEVVCADPVSGEPNRIKIDNVKSVMLHLDEETPHIHAFVVPIDERGNLNARAYTGTREQILHVQDSYAEKMKEFGLERGIRGSIATHEERRAFYGKLTDAISATLPVPERGESVIDYYERANDCYQTARCHHLDKMNKMERKIVEAKTEVLNLRSDLKAISKEELTRDRLKDMKNALSEKEDFKKAVEDYPDREAAEQARMYYLQMLEWQHQREMDEKKKKRVPGEAER